VAAKLWRAGSIFIKVGSVVAGSRFSGAWKWAIRRPAGPTPVVTAIGVTFGRVERRQCSSGKKGKEAVISSNIQVKYRRNAVERVTYPRCFLLHLL